MEDRGLLAYFLLGGTFAGFVALLVLEVMVHLYVCVLARLVAPKLQPGSTYDHWSWMWLRRCLAYDSMHALLKLSHPWRRTQIMVWLCRGCGMKVGSNVVIDVKPFELLANGLLPIRYAQAVPSFVAALSRS